MPSTSNESTINFPKDVEIIADIDSNEKNIVKDVITLQDIPSKSVTMDIETGINLWPEQLSEDNKMYWTQRGFTECQHKGDGTFKESIELQNDGKRRHCTLSMFYCIHERTEEKYERSWLCYSKSSGSIFCFVCSLMSSTVTQFTTGYNDWRNAHDSISSHERSWQYFVSMSALCARNTSGQVDESC